MVGEWQPTSLVTALNQLEPDHAKDSLDFSPLHGDVRDEGDDLGQEGGIGTRHLSPHTWVRDSLEGDIPRLESCQSPYKALERMFQRPWPK